MTQPFYIGDLVSIWGKVCTVIDCTLEDSNRGPYWRVKSTWNGNLSAEANKFTLVRKRLKCE